MARFSDKDYREMPPEVLRSIVRENTHHRLEEPVYESLHEGKPPRVGLGDGIRHLLEIWEERGLPPDGADLDWSRQLVDLADALKSGERPTLETPPVRPFSESELSTVEKLLIERRSIRRWTDQEVPRGMLEKIVEAGLWGPHAC